ncbi:ATP-binding protein [Salibacterium halotolerans]|uniref:ATP-binding protein n=1 Tax=Salibacterium halotolerans TaxID=1884432 RepID=UPI001BAE69EB|nr:ATP-binding protein [Salibacterium halotolerans]
MAGIISYQTQKNDLTDRIEQTLFIYSDNLSLAIEDIIRERLSDLEQLSDNPVLMNDQAEDEEIQQEFMKFIHNHELYYGLIFVNPEGEVTVDTDGTVVGNNVADREWFQQAQEGGLFLSDIFRSPVVDSPILAMASSVENEEGEVIGVISPSFDLEKLWSFLWERVGEYSQQQENMSASADTFILNQSGDYIAHPNQDYILEKNFLEQTNKSMKSMEEFGNQPGLIRNEEGQSVSAIAPVGKMEGFSNEWYVGVSVPENEVYAPLRGLLWKYIALFSVVLLITVTAAFRLSRYITGPVENLVSAASAFAEGKKVPPLHSNAYEEVNKLNRTFNDMTERLDEREKAHRKSTLILEATDNGVISINREDLTITTFNRTCENLFGCKKENVLGRPLHKVKEECPEFAAFIKHVQLSDDRDHRSSIFEFDCSIQGWTHSFFLSNTPLPSSEKDGRVEDYLLVFKEITEKREMERELLRSEKLKVIGRLSAGFAHEIRNPLTTIHGFMQLFKESPDTGGVSSYHYQIIISEIERVNSIVEDLLTIARPEKVEDKDYLDLNEILTHTLYLFQARTDHHNISVVQALDTELPKIYGEEKKLKQVFMNLIKNAVEALEQDGSIMVETTRRSDYSRQGVRIRIIDDGCGMDAETLDKLGSPFYTTKADGTGLGLMTCFQIIEEAGGSMDVSSEEGSGSEFDIWLPVE